MLIYKIWLSKQLNLINDIKNLVSMDVFNVSIKLCIAPPVDYIQKNLRDGRLTYNNIVYKSNGLANNFYKLKECIVEKKEILNRIFFRYITPIKNFAYLEVDFDNSIISKINNHILGDYIILNSKYKKYDENLCIIFY